MRRDSAGTVLGVAVVMALALGPGCSFKKFAVNKLGDALAESGTTYAADDDPDLVRDALPFALKLIESLLEQSPEHLGLLLAAASGFTQYAYAFVQQDADEIEDVDLAAATALRLRARGLFLRARDYGLRGLQVSHPGFGDALAADPASAAALVGKEDVPLLYWMAASWGAAISVARDDLDLVADLPVVGLFLGRALELQEDFDHGAIHEALISYEASRSGARAGAQARAREHFERATSLSGGLRAGAYLALAESVSVQNQDRAEFVSLVEQALAIDSDARPEWRLANLVMQRRGGWLLGRLDLLFVE